MSEPRRLRVAVSSPQCVVAAGLSTLLGRHPERFEVVAVRVASGQPVPDVVLYDALALLDGDGGELTRLVERSASRVLVVHRELRPALLAHALSLGADGFFPLGADEDALVAAVESAGTGWRPGDPGPDPVVGASGSTQRARQLGAEAGLSAREVDVLALATQGWTNQQIADQLYLSINSVKTYLRICYRKINARTRAQAVAWAIQHGFDPHLDRTLRRDRGA